MHYCDGEQGNWLSDRAPGHEYLGVRKPSRQSAFNADASEPRRRAFDCRSGRIPCHLGDRCAQRATLRVAVAVDRKIACTRGRYGCVGTTVSAEVLLDGPLSEFPQGVEWLSSRVAHWSSVWPAIST